jgi:hypothetical protein
MLVEYAMKLLAVESKFFLLLSGFIVLVEI